MFVSDVKIFLETFIVNSFDTNGFTSVNNKTFIFNGDIVGSVKSTSKLGQK